MLWPFGRRIRSPDDTERHAQGFFVFNSQSKSLRFQVADGGRDGLGLELFDDHTACIIAEVFRSDSDNTLTFRCLENSELPFSVVEQMLELARHRLEPFEDGTPLSEATNQRRL